MFFLIKIAYTAKMNRDSKFIVFLMICVIVVFVNFFLFKNSTKDTNDQDLKLEYSNIQDDHKITIDNIKSLVKE